MKCVIGTYGVVMLVRIGNVSTYDFNQIYGVIIMSTLYICCRRNDNACHM